MKISSIRDTSVFTNAKIEECEHGISIEKPKYLYRKFFHLENHAWKRGGITTFSRSSSRNLREKLVRMPSRNQGFLNVGITLTLKKESFFSKENEIEFFNKFWKNFRQRIIDNASKGRFTDKFFLVWRIELTKNKVPHFHIICFTQDRKDVVFLQDIWLKMVEKYYHYSPNREVACKIQDITSSEAAYSYLSCHSSKHKKEQLGWKGRQWGIIFPTKIAKNFLQFLQGSAILEGEEVGKSQLCKGYVEVSFCNYWKFLRVLRHLYKSRLMVGLKTHFLTTDTKKKLMRYIS